MDDFNAKKSRAQKLRQDKHRDRPKKRFDSGSHSSSGKGESKADPRLAKSKNANHEKPTEPGNKSDDNSSEDENGGKVFSRRKLASNWDRYSEPVDMSRFNDDVDTSANFEDLMSMPASGGHLKLKHEHEWDREKTELQMPWFQLNIQAMEKNLSTINFLKRQDLSRELFSESHLQHMMVRAKRNAASITELSDGILKIQSLSMSCNNTKDVETMIDSERYESIPDYPNPCQQKSKSVPHTGEDDDLESILSLHDSSSKPFERRPKNESPPERSEMDREKIEVVDKVPADAMKVSTPPQADNGPSTVQTPSIPAGSLDDWLDSILDD